MAQNIEIVFGHVVRRFREQTGLSQEAFADAVGIHRTYVSLIERGKVQVGIGIAQRLAATLGVRLSELWVDVERELGGDAPSKPRRRHTEH